jgi:hypothetical protein
MGQHKGKSYKKKLLSLFLSLSLCSGSASVAWAAEGSSHLQNESSGGTAFPFTGKLQLASVKGTVGSNVHFQAEGLDPNEPVSFNWKTSDGAYQLDGLYSFIGETYQDKDIPLISGMSDENGEWSGDFQVPEGFGGNHTISVWQGEKKKTQANFFVDPTFTVSPVSGPVGTEITITAEGIGSKEMESNWQLTYDNKLTGLLSAVSTNGKAVSKIRAAGPVGEHTLTIWHGYMGMPYLNHQQAPTSYLPVPTFSFTVTGDQPLSQEVETAPVQAANGGVKVPELQNQPGVIVQLDKTEGIVGDPVTLHASGLPAHHSFDVIWNTMSGSRVSGKGFSQVENDLSSITSDESGNITYSFKIPQDLGGLPHRIDLRDAEGTVYGQAYLHILPSIVQVTPAKAKAGQEIQIELNGVGWTEYDNTYYITYDNAYVGYVCGFNTQGNVKFTLVASGDPGYHIIDLYPGIYRGKDPLPNIYNAPQLTYQNDHPGTAIPAIRLGVEVEK